MENLNNESDFGGRDVLERCADCSGADELGGSSHGTEGALASDPLRANLDRFAQEAGSILVDQCVALPRAGEEEGGLDLSRRASALTGGESGAAIVPGQPGESLLVDKVAEGEMPPKGPLSKEQVAAVRAWVEAGASYPSEPLTPRRAGADWWSLRPIRRVAPPAVARDRCGAGSARRSTRSSSPGSRPPGSAPAPEADRATLIRRVTFDLTGLPPTPEQVDAFVADPDPTAYETLVDRLLASPQYGERWGRHWLDVVRFGESEGYETNLPRPSAWPYRDYVIRAFNRDTPFPRSSSSSSPAIRWPRGPARRTG